MQSTTEWLRILLVEDDSQFIGFIQHELIKGMYEFETTIATDEESYSDAVRNNKFDIIFCDYSITGFSLSDALRINKSLNLAVPVIGISSRFGEEFATDILSSGAHDYINKDNLYRLPAIVNREIKATKISHERKKFQKNLLNMSYKFSDKFEEQTSVLKQEIINLQEELNEKNQIEDYLKSELILLQSILDILPSAVYVKESESKKFSYINKTVEKATGYNESDLIGKTVYDVFSKDLADIYNAEDLRLKLTNQFLNIGEELYKTKSNGFKIFNKKKALIPPNSINPEYIADICDDVTYINSVERDIIDKELKFSALFKSSPVAMLVLRFEDLAILDFNNSFLELTGFSESEIIGKPISLLNLWLDIKMYERFIAVTKEYGKAENQEISLETKNGKTLTAIISAECIKPELDLLWIILTIQDISQRKEADEEIRQALNKEKNLNLLKSRFLSMVSHEFRTPLTSIMLSADLLKNYSDRWSDDEKKKHYDRIQRTALNMTYLMENILTAGKMESGTFDFKPEEIDISSFCRAITENISFISGGTHPIRVINKCEKIRLNADKNLLNLILSNLLTNAVKYSPKGSEVILELTPSIDYLLFYVKDYGIGIPKEDIPNLFKIYFRARNTTSTIGCGLGLSIVKKCVETHHGEIFVESEERFGTTFCVKIPFEINNS